MDKPKTALIIGAGPAGLTAAYELLLHTEIKPIVIEMSDEIGGLSRTVNYKGNHLDIGGHRFFSKSDVVMNWWQEIMPIESDNKEKINITYHNKSKEINLTDKTNDSSDKFLIRNRKSRIYFLNTFFSYPLKLNFDTFKKIGFFRSIKICFSYLKAFCFPISDEKNLEDFFINRFGRELYQTFFKDYTEKVWGVSCKEIPATWGKQRIKELNIFKLIKHYFKNMFNSNNLFQKKTETSLIEKFLYPKFGPGNLWTNVASLIEKKGGLIIKNQEVVSIKNSGGIINEVTAKNETGILTTYTSNYFISTMPIKDLVNSFEHKIPENVNKIATGLLYRDFITVGLLLNKLDINKGKLIDDNWIYIQENKVKIGRLQIFNNWSPYLVKDPTKVWLGLEYFCNENDSLWNMTDENFINFAIQELKEIKIINPNEVIDSTIIRVKKAYPTYFGSYSEFETLKTHLNTYENLFLIGRNGMHKYNNQDHSMLTAIQTVQNIKNNIINKDNIWEINTEEEYHEENKENHSI